MKKVVITFLTLFVMALLHGCSNDDFEPVVDDEPVEEKSSEVIYISYQDAIEAGYPCYDASHYNDPIYPTDSVHLILPKKGGDVVLELLSMGKVSALSYMIDFGQSKQFEYYKSKNYMTFCEDDNCFVFLPYEIPTKRGLTIIQDEADKIIFRTDPSYKNLAKGYYVYVRRNYNLFGPLLNDHRQPPRLKVTLTYE